MNHQLISDAEAKNLSRRMAELGDQMEDIGADLDRRGYGRPAAVKRGLIEELATDAAALDRLRLYWREYAKERLASLAGPVNIPRGRYPPICEYRSALIARLRDEAATKVVGSDEATSSPQIEPTYKRFVEKKRTPQQLREMAAALESARSLATSELGLEERADFSDHIHLGRRDKVSEIVASRFSANMEPDGFRVRLIPDGGLVCRKSMGGLGLDFVLSLQYKASLIAGVTFPMFSLTLSGQRIDPGALHGFAVASFSPEVLVPEFYDACAFTPDSYAQMCLAVDSISYMCNNVCERVMKILRDAGGVISTSRN